MGQFADCGLDHKFVIKFEQFVIMAPPVHPENETDVFHPGIEYHFVKVNLLIRL
jgi:hypothetical protein